MFCVKCGKLNRDEANYCAHCGANTGQAAPPREPVKPAGLGRTLWMAGLAAFLVFIGIVMSVAVCAWALNQAYEDGQVVVDGKIVVGADGEPIELVQNSAAADVSWDQLRQFLSDDRTDRIRYDDDTFVCADFAETLHNNAEEAGIRAGYVFIQFPGETPAHTCNVFYTTDRGRVYVDDTGTIDGSINADKTVDLAVGRAYCPVSIFPNPGYDEDWDCMGRVSGFTVSW